MLPPSLNDNALKYLPDENLDVFEENLKLFWYWIYERHTIYNKRFIKKLPAPWTKDPILRDYKFTNVYRELDRVSVWAQDNIIFRDDWTKFQRIFCLISFKLFNNTDTFTEIPLLEYNNFDSKDFEKRLDKIVERGGHPFTDAYLTNSMAYQGMKRHTAYAKHVIPFVHKNMKEFFKIIITAKKPEDIINHFKIIKGVADFVAYELYCDLDYFNPLIMKFDQNDYVNVGPGAVTGVRWIFPNKGNYKDAKKVIYHLRDNQKDYFKMFGFKDFPYLQNKYKKLTLREIEHSLCEFQKYMKMKFKVGKQRQKFIPKTKVI